MLPGSVSGRHGLAGENARQDLAVEWFQQEVVGTGPLTGHHLPEIGLNDTIVNSHRRAFRQATDIADQVERAIKARIDDQNVGKFGFASHERFKAARRLGNQEAHPRKDTLSDLAHNIRPVSYHQAPHDQTPSRLAKRETISINQSYMDLAKKPLPR
ncbi:hypothetical protein EMEDMD4_310065 [Sinorhizobium medicae]|uniref:Uncharacterized protein n=1 Tax=Sinorhizobium medicae TaxID=110321 RepID=A0A508WX48_9HYPH|nr:hypothetical protein EMEDMD4_310065 [Sinorhizobium medicae]